MLSGFDHAPVWAIHFAWTAATLLGAWLAGHLLKALVLRRLVAWASRSHAKWDGRGVFAIAVASITLTVAEMASRLVADYGARGSPDQQVTTLSRNVAWIIVVTFGILILLNGLGVSITPMVTAFGVGGIAVALAVQDPLANLFAGLLVTLARQVRVGDYIKLDAGVEGEIIDFTWRLTRIRTLADKIVLVPNAKLAQAIVTNYSLPNRDVLVPIDVGVDAASDLEQVERAVLDVGRDVMARAAGVSEREPMVRYHTFGNALVKFTVFLHSRDYRDQTLVTHEFTKRLHERFRRDGIVVRA